MDYPSDFPEEAQAAVEHVRILADRVFDEFRQKIHPSFHTSEGELRLLIRAYIVKIVKAFGHEACQLGRARLWTVVKIEAEVHKFMRQVASKACREKRYPRRTLENRPSVDTSKPANGAEPGQE